MTEPTPPTSHAGDTSGDPAGSLAATDPQAQPGCAWQQRAEQAEARLDLLRRQLRDAVVADELDAESANDLLAAAGLPLLPRRWTVDLLVTLTLMVVADSSDDAFDTARTTVDGALHPVGIGYDETDVGDATPGDVVDDPTDT